MLLRRVTQHLRDQNWTAIGIDFVIVVIGVYVGIEVSNWNERRTEARHAEEYLERIEADLVYNSQSLIERRRFWTDVVEQARHALAFAEQGVLTEGSAWKTLRAFLHASQVWRFVFNNNTYAEMRSAGDLSLIDNGELRAVFAEYFDTRKSRRDAYYLFFPDYRVTVRSAVPSQVSKYYWDECHWQAVERQALRACEAPIEEAEARALLDELLAIPDLLPQLRYWVSSLDLLIELADIDIPLSEELATRVAAERR